MEAQPSWLESEWFIGLSGVASIAGFTLSLWVAIQLYQIRTSYVSRARLIEIQRSCVEILSGVNRLAIDGTDDCLSRAWLEINSVKTHLSEAETYFPWGRRRRLRKKIRDIGERAASVAEIAERYSECQQAIIVIDSLISEKNWG